MAADGAQRKPQPLVLHELLRLTTRFNDADSLDARMRRAGQLFAFLWEAADAPGTADRMASWLDLLEQDQVLATEFQARWLRMLAEVESVSLFAESGLPRHSGLMAEALRRIFQRLLPSAREEHDAGRLFAYIFASRRAVERFMNLPEEIFTRMEAVLRPRHDAACKQRLNRDVREGLCLLAARVCGRGASEAVRRRSSSQDFQESPFYGLLFRTRQLVDAPNAEDRARESAFGRKLSRGAARSCTRFMCIWRMRA